LFQDQKKAYDRFPDDIFVGPDGRWAKARRNISLYAWDEALSFGSPFFLAQREI
jgi:hypothetical protein